MQSLAGPSSGPAALTVRRIRAATASSVAAAARRTAPTAQPTVARAGEGWIRAARTLVR